MKKTITKTNYCNIENMLKAYLEPLNQVLPLHITPLYSKKISVKKILKLLHKSGYSFEVMPEEYKKTQINFSKLNKAKIVVQVEENILAYIFEHSIVFSIKDINFVIKEDKSCFLGFLRYKRLFQNYFLGKQRIETTEFYYIDRIKNNIKKFLLYLKLPNEFFYVMSMLFSEKHCEPQMKTAIMDPSLVIYNPSEYYEYNNSTIKERVASLKKILTTDIENREPYDTCFSWSLILIQGEYKYEVYLDYFLLEVQLQKEWNYILMINRKLNKRMKLLFNFDNHITKLIKFEYELNSIEDACDSERIITIKNHLIKSSRIRTLISQARQKIEYKKSKFNVNIGFLTMILSLGTLIISLVILFS